MENLDIILTEEDAQTVLAESEEIDYDDALLTDSMKLYLKEINQIPLLTFEQEKELGLAITQMLGIRPSVHLVAPKTIARSEGKAVRVVDKRKLHD